MRVAQAVFGTMSALSVLACTEPSDARLVHVEGRVTETTGIAIESLPVSVLLAGQKGSLTAVAISDADGRFVAELAPDEAINWYDELIVSYAGKYCGPWRAASEARPLARLEDRSSAAFDIKLVAPEKLAGSLNGQMCAVGRQVATDYLLALSVDAFTLDSAFGRFAVHYTLSTSSDFGTFRGAFVTDHIGTDEIELEMAEEGDGSCPDGFRLGIRFRFLENITEGYLVPLTPCVIHADSVRLIQEDGSLF